MASRLRKKTQSTKPYQQKQTNLSLNSGLSDFQKIPSRSKNMPYSKKNLDLVNLDSDQNYTNSLPFVHSTISGYPRHEKEPSVTKSFQFLTKKNIDSQKQNSFAEIISRNCETFEKKEVN